MSDDGMDLCENLWNHELAMRRLLSLLRQGQTYCTDSECLDELPGLGDPSSNTNFMLMGFLLLFGLLLYTLRPRSTRTQLQTKSFNSQGPSGLPPPPPPPAAPTN